ncbi:DUF4945 domain-containing protein [Pontibacter sp. 172403-2]|uniref:DUF4945 domain-containing protein n=1 Tax=Pontibacter rufus TaxID=2791028 RepID=UPI0018AF7DF5|nr:DUF4945 domain-containing protein [Pontibacter sp. 172403-2]MBF9255727.1 DUF4945 domain-containing protein [Pontibacter sp. 172403-2]
MKKYIFYISIICVLFAAGCKEEDIVLSKPGEPIAPVTNLDYTISGSDAILTWDLPSTLPDDIIEPVSVFIRISVDGQSAGTLVVDDAPESFVYSPYDASKKYKFTVKVQGKVDTTDPYRSDLRLSPGTTVAF